MVCVVMSVCFYGLFPREWMDVLSPPIMPPSQQRRSGNAWNNGGSLVRGTETFILVPLPADCLFVCESQEDRKQSSAVALTLMAQMDTANGNIR